MIICQNKNCKEQATFRFTWPGHKEQYCCDKHKRFAESAAVAMGFNQQFIPIKKEHNEGTVN